MVKPALIAIAALSLCATAQAQLSTELPVDLHDPAIEDRLAMAVVPTLWAGREAQGYLPAKGFEAHLVAVNHPRRELVYPAGEWFFPPPGLYHVWAEGHGWISPYPTRLGTGRGDAHMVVRPDMVPGGRVTLSAADAASGAELILLSASRDFRGRHPHYEMKKRLPAAAVGDGVLLPEGDALALLWNEGARRIVALSRPFRVIYEDTVEAPLEAPTSAAALFVDLVRDYESEDGEHDLIAPRLRHGGEELAPARVVATAIHTYAVWYDLPPGRAVLTAHGERTAVVPEALDLEAGEVELRQLRMGPRRDLEVDLDLPPPLDREPVTLVVHPVPPTVEWARAVLPPEARGHRFEGLVPAAAEVELRTAAGSLHRSVDLGGTPLSHLLLAPRPLFFSGRVTVCGEGHAATLALTTTGGEEVAVASDATGAWRATLIEPLRDIEVRLGGGTQAAGAATAAATAAATWVGTYSPPVDHDRALAFDLAPAP